MPGMFIDDEDRVPITVDGEVDPSEITPATDVIWIYPAMPAGIEQKVISRAVQMRQAKNGQRPARGRRGKSEIDTTYDAGLYNLALLEHNVLDWQGPAFLDRQGRKVPCTPERVRALNPQMPLVRRVLEEIGERNAPADDGADESPNDAAPADPDAPPWAQGNAPGAQATA